MKKCILLFLLSFLYLGQLDAQIDNYTGGYEGQKLDWLFFYLNKYYVDELDEDTLATIAIRRVIQELDPFSSYQTKAEAEAQQNNDKGYSGKAAGFNFYFIKDTAMVTYVDWKGPADIAGLKRGDQIISINGQRMTGKKYKQLRGMLDDENVNDLDVEILRFQNPMKVRLTKALVPWHSVNSAYMLTSTTGYIKIAKFTQKTVEEFKGSLNYLKSKGLQQLILDLRGNFGGVVEQARLLADEFLSEGKVIYSIDGANLEREEFISTAGGAWEKGKLTIIQDVKTASASELFISALQDWDRAVILGVGSYGKGLVQQSYKLGDGSNVRLTIGRYFSPTGRKLQKEDYKKRWLDPYLDALSQNSMTKDLKVPNHMKGKTKSGRSIVVADGGVTPDVHYIPIEKESKDLLNTLLDNGALYYFTANYVKEKRGELLSDYRTVRAFLEDRIYEAFMLQSLRKYLSENYPSIQLPANFPNNVIHQIQKWTASLLWHDNAFYEADNNDDQLMFRAREISEGKIHDSLGVKY